MRRMEAFFQARGQEMPETNRKQAFLPQGCVVFRNDHGTAPGCAVEKGGKIVINLPGPRRVSSSPCSWSKRFLIFRVLPAG